MKLKKLLQGTMFVAAAAICMMAGTVTAKADAISDAGVSQIKVNADGTMTATQSGGQELMVGVASVSKAGVAKVSAWDVYESTSAVTIDLSKLSNTKDNYIALMSNAKETPVLVKIPASAKVVKAQLNEKTESNTTTVTLHVGSGAKASEASPAEVKADTYEYRTVYKGWTDLYASSKSADMSIYQKQGATIYVREKGVADTAALGDTNKGDTVTFDGKEAQVYNSAGKLPSKEGKISIKGMAKGPSVAADYAKGEVTLPAKSEWRIVKANATINKNAAKGKKNMKDLLGDTDTKGTLEVRIEATAKKPASKWTSLSLQKAEAIASGMIKTGIQTATKIEANTIDVGKTTSYGGKDTDGVAAAEVKEASDGKSIVKITYKKDSLVIANTGEKDYEFALGDSATAKPADNAVIKKVAAGKTVTIKGFKDAGYLYVRVAGNKKAKTWVGDFTYLGIIDYEKPVVGTKPVS